VAAGLTLEALREYRLWAVVFCELKNEYAKPSILEHGLPSEQRYPSSFLPTPEAMTNIDTNFIKGQLQQ
jgi:hypothetical protein